MFAPVSVRHLRMLLSIKTVQMPFVISDPDIYQNTIHFDVVHRKLTRKDMRVSAPITEEEVGLAYEGI